MARRCGGGSRGLRADTAALLVMRTDPEARYDRFDHVLAEVKRAGIRRLGFAGIKLASYRFYLDCFDSPASKSGLLSRISFNS